MKTPKKKVQLALIEAARAAFLIWIRNKWSEFSNEPLMIGEVRTADDVKGLQHLFGKAPDYPFGMQVFAGVRLDTARGGLSTRFQEIQGKVDAERSRATLLRLTPILIGLGIQLRVVDIAELTNFITMAYATAPGPTLTLTMNDGFFIQCRVVYPPDLDFPIGGDSDGKYYQMDFPIVINAWSGYSYDVGLIRTIKISVNDSTNQDIGELTLNDDGKVEYINLLGLTERFYTDPYDTTKSGYQGEDS